MARAHLQQSYHTHTHTYTLTHTHTSQSPPPPVPSGYVGKVTRVTTEAANDQGLTNSCLNVSGAGVRGGQCLLQLFTRLCSCLVPCVFTASRRLQYSCPAILSTAQQCWMTTPAHHFHLPSFHAQFAFATVDGAAPENAHPEPTPEVRAVCVRGGVAASCNEHLHTHKATDTLHRHSCVAHRTPVCNKRPSCYTRHIVICADKCLVMQDLVVPAACLVDLPVSRSLAKTSRCCCSPSRVCQLSSPGSSSRTSGPLTAGCWLLPSDSTLQQSVACTSAQGQQTTD